MTKNIKGQSLFEVIVALSVVALIMVGLVRAATLSISNSTVSKNKAQANAYASELSEWLRGERDINWLIFKAHFNATPTFCFDTYPLGWTKARACTATEVVSPNTIFTRSAVFTCHTYSALTGTFTQVPNCNSVSIAMIQAVITINWVEGTVTHSVVVTTNLTNSKSP